MRRSRFLQSFILFVLACFATAALAAEAAEAPAGAQIPIWAPMLVPIIVFFAKIFVEKYVPDWLIERIKAELIPTLTTVGTGLATSGFSESISFTQGMIIGLAGVGVHQTLKQAGILGIFFPSQRT